jgi:hypothetical protein
VVSVTVPNTKITDYRNKLKHYQVLKKWKEEELDVMVEEASLENQQEFDKLDIQRHLVLSNKQK